MPRTRNFKELTAKIDADPRRRARVDRYKRAALDAMKLADLREGRELRQTDVAQVLGVSQANVSRLEGESDVYLSTLRNYVKALGGSLEIQAVFPDQRVSLGDLSRDDPPGDRVRASKVGTRMASSRKTGAKAGKAASKASKRSK